jgi:predicted CXXCH cytochrome family protein
MPTPDPGPTPAADPSPDASPTLDPTPDPALTPDPMPAPPPTPATDPTTTPAPSLEVPFPLYPLVQPADGPSAEPAQLSGPSPFTSPHTAYTLTADACSACHRAHTGQSAMLGAAAAPSATLCFACHDGSGALANVLATFTDPALPPNDATTSSWYAHPATVDLGHMPGVVDEFGGVANRHATCTDCHQPHRADGTLSSRTVAGWTVSGALLGISGVAVSNGAPGAAPAYSLTTDPALEYELCFKCHSGYTTLPAQDPAHPSRWALDKGIELNPANGSYHPIEAAGTNGTDAMAASLAGGTLWQFGRGDTVRCVNCHGDPSKAGAGATTGPDDRLASHASPERGILIAPYRDRLLKPAGEAYQPTDFTLCFLCHSSEPFTVESSTATNFSLHAKHVSGLADRPGGGTDIDVGGAGEGDAICAECHFRLHSTALAVQADERDNSRLVNFAPNVEPYLGTLTWAAGPGGSCTLVCHGQVHDGVPY